MLKLHNFKTLSLTAAFAVAFGSYAASGYAQTVKIDGSSTVYPVTEAVAEEFQKAKKGKIKGTVGRSGTGGARTQVFRACAAVSCLLRGHVMIYPKLARGKQSPAEDISPAARTTTCWFKPLPMPEMP